MISKQFIYDEVALGLRLRNIDEKETKKKSGKIPRDLWFISLYRLAYFSLKLWTEKKELTIASILALNPKIIILDEPTAGQDYKHYTEIMEFLRKINKLGVTIILITHDMHLMLEYTPRSIVLTNGEVIADTKSAITLTDEEIIKYANLKETSLYHLAHRANIDNEGEFVQHFIDYERWLRSKNEN